MLQESIRMLHEFKVSMVTMNLSQIIPHLMQIDKKTFYLAFTLRHTRYELDVEDINICFLLGIYAYILLPNSRLWHLWTLHSIRMIQAYEVFQKILGLFIIIRQAVVDLWNMKFLCEISSFQMLVPGSFNFFEELWQKKKNKKIQKASGRKTTVRF